MPRKTSKEASNPILWIQTLIKCGEYQISSKVESLIFEGDCTLDDIEVSIMSGDKMKREKDKMKTSCDGMKYTIYGYLRNGLPFATTGKIMEDSDGEYYFIITAFRRN